ncbi:glutathione-dependent formaldehyde-activating protein [Scenedesmus sp. NREL 46B-D3]|nr:glutathione-dependent formaldehyde-activating protein [Scenedesmus sp. NREL 46B-D3]
MLLKGSCHCGAVRFSVQSSTPVPFMRCYCTICRKTGGGGGYAINLGAHSETLQVQGQEHTRIYHAKMRDDKGKESSSTAERHFCGLCGSHLWLYRRAHAGTASTNKPCIFQKQLVQVIRVLYNMKMVVPDNCASSAAVLCAVTCVHEGHASRHMWCPS